MYSLFVLGIIPGTNIQITFQIWFDSLLMAVELLSFVWLYRRYRATWQQHIPLTLLLVRHFLGATWLRLLVQLKAFMASQNAAWE